MVDNENLQHKAIWVKNFPVEAGELLLEMKQEIDNLKNIRLIENEASQLVIQKQCKIIEQLREALIKKENMMGNLIDALEKK